MKIFIELITFINDETFFVIISLSKSIVLQNMFPIKSNQTLNQILFLYNDQIYKCSCKNVKDFWLIVQFKTNNYNYKEIITRKETITASPLPLSLKLPEKPIEVFLVEYR